MSAGTHGAECSAAERLPRRSAGAVEFALPGPWRSRRRFNTVIGHPIVAQSGDNYLTRKGVVSILFLKSRGGARCLLQIFDGLGQEP